MEDKTMKRLGLISLLGLALAVVPGAAHAAAWGGHAGGAGVHGGWGGGGWHGSPGGFHGAPAYHPVTAQGYHAAPGFRGPVYGAPVGRHYAPVYGHVGVVSPVSPVWVPGYWGWNGGVRVWIGANWAYPPYAGWVWVRPHWVWNGYQWVWQNGYWTPPPY
jgi:hypothetical protein